MSFSAFIIGLSGIPDDVNQWLTWADQLLKAINLPLVRAVLGVFGVVSFIWFALYSKAIRQQVRNTFRTGSTVKLIPFHPPLLSNGWTAGTHNTSHSTNHDEPEFQLEEQPSGYACRLTSDSPTSLRYEITDPDPTAGYIRFRGRLRQLHHDDRLLMFSPSRWDGVDFAVELTMRRKNDQTEIPVRLMIRLGAQSRNVSGGHSHVWVVEAPTHLDFQGRDVAIVNIKDVISRGYPKNTFGFMGVAALEMEVANVSVETVKILRPATWPDWCNALFSKRTWIPWG